MASPLVVIDTGVIIRALIGGTGASSYQTVRSAGTGAVRVALSDEGLRELARIVREKDEQGLVAGASRAFEIAQDLWTHGELYRPARHDWPSIPDQDDGWLLDLALASAANYIVTWDPHLLDHDIPLPTEVITPAELLRRLRAGYSQDRRG